MQFDSVVLFPFADPEEADLHNLTSRKYRQTHGRTDLHVLPTETVGDSVARRLAAQPLLRARGGAAELRAALRGRRRPERRHDGVHGLGERTHEGRHPGLLPGTSQRKTRRWYDKVATALFSAMDTRLIL